jgi:hypothetical protein
MFSWIQGMRRWRTVRPSMPDAGCTFTLCHLRRGLCIEGRTSSHTCGLLCRMSAPGLWASIAAPPWTWRRRWRHRQPSAQRPPTAQCAGQLVTGDFSVHDRIGEMGTQGQSGTLHPVGLFMRFRWAFRRLRCGGEIILYSVNTAILVRHRAGGGYQSPGIQAGCCTFVLYRAVRTQELSAGASRCLPGTAAFRAGIPGLPQYADRAFWSRGHLQAFDRRSTARSSGSRRAQRRLRS